MANNNERELIARLRTAGIWLLYAWIVVGWMFVVPLFFYLH